MVWTWRKSGQNSGKKNQPFPDSQLTLFSLHSLFTVSSAPNTPKKPFSSTNSWEYPPLTYPQLLQQPSQFAAPPLNFSSLFSSSKQRQRFLPLVCSQPLLFPPPALHRPSMLASHPYHAKWSASLPLPFLLLLLHAVQLFQWTLGRTSSSPANIVEPGPAKKEIYVRPRSVKPNFPGLDPVR
jgi:hypothetical protein